MRKGKLTLIELLVVTYNIATLASMLFSADVTVLADTCGGRILGTKLANVRSMDK